jgi:hypothetical protein
MLSPSNMIVQNLAMSLLKKYFLTAYKGGIKPLPVIGPNGALRLEVMIDHKDGDVERLAGEMFQLDAWT